MVSAFLLISSFSWAAKPHFGSSGCEQFQKGDTDGRKSGRTRCTEGRLRDQVHWRHGFQKNTIFGRNTVDGRNPPVDTANIQFFTVLYAFQVVQDFWTINSMENFLPMSFTKCPNTIPTSGPDAGAFLHQSSNSICHLMKHEGLEWKLFNFLKNVLKLGTLLFHNLSTLSWPRSTHGFSAKRHRDKTSSRFKCWRQRKLLNPSFPSLLCFLPYQDIQRAIFY